MRKVGLAHLLVQPANQVLLADMACNLVEAQLQGVDVLEHHLFGRDINLERVHGLLDGKAGQLDREVKQIPVAQVGQRVLLHHLEIAIQLQAKLWNRSELEPELGRGSMATVLRLLQTWQAGQGRAQDTPVALPPALQRALVNFIGQEVAAAKLSLEQDLVNAQQAQKDLITENEGQAADLEGLQMTLEEMQAEHSQLEGRYAQLQADFAGAKQVSETQRQAAESARTEIAKLQLRLEGAPPLESEVARLREVLEAERSARVASDQIAAVANAKL